MAYAVVFSGGGALGAWEVGCYKSVLAAHGDQPPACVTGASAGALNAAAITAGMSVGQISEFWVSLKASNVFTPDISIASVLWTLAKCAVRMSKAPLFRFADSKKSVLKTEALLGTLTTIFNGFESAFLHSPIWFAISLTNLTTRTKEIFYKIPPGSFLPASFQVATLPKEQPPVWRPVNSYMILRQALMGTTALPLLFPPFESYFDGGVLLNQPISPAIQIMDAILDPDNKLCEPLDIYVFIPEPEALGTTEGLPSIATTVLSTWLSASLLSQVAMAKWRNRIRIQAGKGAIRLCVVRPSADFQAGLLDFGKNVSSLIDQGEKDCSARLEIFDPANEYTWY